MVFVRDEWFWNLVWPDVERLGIDAVGAVGDAVWVGLHARQPAVACPSCGVTASRVHSTYMRRLADRPLGGRRVLLRLRSRRFFCDNGLRSRRTTAEQVLCLTTRYRRRTTALARLVQAIGLTVGGRAGARLAGYLPVQTSRDVILRELRRLPDPPSAQVTVLGIDEFAFRRGATYGTVLIDVETRRPIDLLPDRTADKVASWLADHPEIKVISRDRCSTFSQAAARVAPEAIQVADRWHLLHSLARAVERTAHQHRACLRKDAETGETDQSQEPSDPTTLAALIGPPEPSDPPDGQLPARVRQWHIDIHQLHERGWTISAIADRLGRDRKTVRHYLTTDLDQILASARERRPNGHIHRFKPYLQQRFRAGTAIPEPPRPISSPRRITTWIMRHPDTLTESQRDQIDRILYACPDLTTARDLAHEFSAITRERRGHDLTGWMTQALDNGPSPIQGFAAFLQNDWDAVVNGLTLPRSSGAAEGWSSLSRREPMS
ncbi:ISL3 family transposase [Streptomyces vinaceus]|uniref:ISL3 family transposase n=1 Tax=Streptomyces vinaceus TaxID=1960 RepID=UPI0035E1D320